MVEVSKRVGGSTSESDDKDMNGHFESLTPYFAESTENLVSQTQSIHGCFYLKSCRNLDATCLAFGFKLKFQCLESINCFDHMHFRSGILSSTPDVCDKAQNISFLSQTMNFRWVQKQNLFLVLDQKEATAVFLLGYLQ